MKQSSVAFLALCLLVLLTAPSLIEAKLTVKPVKKPKKKTCAPAQCGFKICRNPTVWTKLTKANVTAIPEIKTDAEAKATAWVATLPGECIQKKLTIFKACEQVAGAQGVVQYAAQALAKCNKKRTYKTSWYVTDLAIAII